MRQRCHYLVGVGSGVTVEVRSIFGPSMQSFRISVILSNDHKYVEATHIKAHIFHINTSWLPDRNSQHPFYQTESFISTPALRGAQMSSVYGAMTPGVVIIPSSISSWPAIAAGTPTVTAIAEWSPGLPYVSSVDVRVF